jgi:hypothetical protein
MKRKLKRSSLKLNSNLHFYGFMKCKQCLETYTTKAYALLWEQCAKGMKNTIESRTDFDTNIKDNPIKLLKAIKQHVLNHEQRYEMSIVLTQGVRCYC